MKVDLDDDGILHPMEFILVGMFGLVCNSSIGESPGNDEVIGGASVKLLPIPFK